MEKYLNYTGGVYLNKSDEPATTDDVVLDPCLGKINCDEGAPAQTSNKALDELVNVKPMATAKPTPEPEKVKYLNWFWIITGCGAAIAYVMYKK